jgi:TolA-binding protein
MAQPQPERQAPSEALRGREPGRRRLRARRRATVLAFCAIATAGCSGVSPFARWQMANDTGVARGLNESERGGSGWLDRIWPSVKPPQAFTGPDPINWNPDGWKKAADPETHPEAAAEEKAALALFEQGKLAEAEKAFARIAKKRKDTPFGEKAQYYVAECQYQRGKLSAAHTSYEKLFADYPGSAYVDKLVKREFTIADIWFKAEDSKSPPEKREKWYDRFTGRLPFFGVNDWAIQAIEHARQHDPKGPLADDAYMRLADHYYDHRNWEMAAFHYDALINDPDQAKSPFIQRAQMQSIDAKMKGYLGPEYDATGLEEAKSTVRRTLDQFPERKASTTESLFHTLDIIREEEAKRAYEYGDHYLWTGHLAGAEYYFGMIPARWPKSPYATKAKDKLAKIAKMPRKQTEPSKIMARPGAIDPYANGISAANPGAMMNGGMGMGMAPGR